MKPNIKIFLLTFLLGIFSTLSAHLNPVSADLVDEGKDLLIKDYEPYLADAKFSAALALNPSDEKANFWRALTIGMTNPDLKAEFLNMGLIDASDHLALDKAHEPTMSYTLIGTQIIDNPDTTSGYSEEGEGWVTDTLEEPYGDDCRVHPVGTGLNKAIWTFDIPLAGTYDLSLWWPYSPNNSTDARFTIFYDGGSQTIIRSQRWNSGGWQHLGKFYFSPGAQARVELTDETSTGNVVADAARLEFQDIFLDTDAPYATFDGVWSDIAHSNARYGSYKQIPAGTGGSCTWTYEITLSGRYQLSGRWAASTSNATNAVFEIRKNGGLLASISVDQQQNNLDDVSLGLFEFQASDTMAVTLFQNDSGAVTTDGITIVPVHTYPAMSGFQNILASTLTQIDEAIVCLNKVTNGFQDTADFQATNDLGDPVLTQLDYGDALLLKGIFYFFKSQLNSFAANNMDTVDGHVLGSRYYGLFHANSLLSEFPNLFTLNLDASSRMAVAKQAFINAIDCYRAAYNSITTESDDQQDDFATFDADYTKDVVPTMHPMLDKITSNLIGTTPYFTVKSDDFDFSSGDDSYFNMKINWRASYDNPTALRSLIPQFDANDSLLRSTAPDPTFGGMLPDEKQEDFNGIAGLGSKLNQPKVSWGEDSISITLHWAKDTYTDFVRYKIFRSTTETVDESSTQVYDSTDINTVTFVDTIALPVQEKYYYRLYTYYSDGDKSASYINRVVTNIYVDIGNTSGNEDGSQQHPYSDLGDAIHDYGSAGCKILVAQGTYPESDVSLYMSGKSGLVLQGGYESNNWTRNIQAYETIIDATGKTGWHAVIFSGMNGGGIDGFTIIGAGGLIEGTGICLLSSTNIKIKNCKITNNKRGIDIAQRSSCSIEDCSISQIVEAGVALDNASTLVMKRTSISNCASGINGWGISSFNLSEVTVSGNGSPGGSNYAVDFQACSVIADKLLVNNNNEHGVFIRELSMFNIKNSEFRGNAKDGLVCSRGYGTLFNSLITNNSGRGVSLQGSNSEGSIVLDNITIANNTGDAVDIFAPTSGTFIPQLKNCIIANNGGYGVYVAAPSLPTVAYCDVFGNTSGNYSGSYTNGGGNISQAPLFLTGPNGNYYLSQIAAGQASNSPAVDAGSTGAVNKGLQWYTTRTDKHGDTGTVDMGYHYPTEGIIVDNTDSNTSKVGTWTVSTNTPGYYGTNYQYRFAGTGANKFTWLPAVPTTGTYEVFARWTSYSNRASNTKYAITNHTGTTAPVEVNQQANNGVWVSLGKYSFKAAGTAQITLTDNANGVVIADAVKLVYISPNTDLVVDNTDPNTSKIGTWTTSTSTPGYYGTNYQYRAAGTGTNRFTWLPNIATSGTYEVFARWTSYSNRATNAKYTVTNHTGSSAPIAVNQQTNNAIWVSLGKYSFQAGGTAQVNLSDNANGIVIADAIKLVYINSQIDVVVDNTDGNISTVGSWTVSTSTPGYYGSNYQYRFAGTGANKFTWLPAVPTTGTYEVFARWTSYSNRATNAKYTVTNHTGSTLPVEVSQQSSNGVWVSLGKYSFQAGGTAQISLSDNANNVVIADAVKLVYNN